MLCMDPRGVHEGIALFFFLKKVFLRNTIVHMEKDHDKNNKQLFTSLQNIFLRHFGWRLLHRLIGFGFLQKEHTISTWKSFGLK